MSPDSTSQLRDRIMGASDMPFTDGHLRWLSDGGQVTPAAFKRVVELQFTDYFKTDRSDGSGRLRASNFGDIGMRGREHCDRKHILSFLGIQQDPRDSSSIEIMNTGTQLHYYLQQAGLSAGWLADIEIPVAYEPWRLRGSMDGLLTDGTGLEIKTTGSYNFTIIDNKRKDIEEANKNIEDQGSKTPIWRAASLSHLWQIHMYMQAMDLDKFSLVYIDRGFPSKFLELRIPRDEHIMADVTQAMERLISHIDSETLPPMLEDCQRERGATYEACQYRSTCPTVGGFA